MNLRLSLQDLPDLSDAGGRALKAASDPSAGPPGYDDQSFSAGFHHCGALLLAWMPHLTASQRANVMSVEAITEGGGASTPATEPL
jgi:hypothetical protein